MQDDEKVVAPVYGTAAQTICNDPCHLVGAIVTPDGTNKTYIDIYDGENTTAPKIARIRATTDESAVCIFPNHIKMNRGIYVDTETNLESFTILWHTI